MILDKKLFIVIWLSGTLSVLAVLPYAFQLQQDLLQSAPFSVPILALLSFIQGAILLAIATSLGLFYAKKVGFQLPVVEQMLRRRANTIQWNGFLKLPLLLGTLTAVAIVFGDWLFTLGGVVIDAKFVTEIPIWKRFFAAFYGGIAEEILMRLFLVSLLVWIMGKLTRSQARLSRSGLVWFAIAVVSIIFGLGHLPATSAVTELTSLVIARAIVLNGVAGLVFGWLYWKRGLESAMMAHFAADIMILIVLPAILA